MLSHSSSIQIGQTLPRQDSREIFNSFQKVILYQCIFLFRKTTLRYVSPSRDLQTSLVITVYCLLSCLLTYLPILFTWKVAGDLKILKLGLKFRYEVEFEFNLKDFLKCFLKNVKVVVSGGSFFLVGPNKDIRRCFLWCPQVSSSSSLLFISSQMNSA